MDIGWNYLNHFCDNETKRAEFVALVLNGNKGLFFSDKTKILEDILKRKYPNEFKKEYRKIIDRIDKVRRFRNRLAHSSFDVFQVYDISDPTTDSITLYFYENGKKKTELITQADFKQRIDEAFDIMMELHFLSGKMFEKGFV